MRIITNSSNEKIAASLWNPRLRQIQLARKGVFAQLACRPIKHLRENGATDDEMPQ
jgi:hypothetical protein